MNRVFMITWPLTVLILSLSFVNAKEIPQKVKYTFQALIVYDRSISNNVNALEHITVVELGQNPSFRNILLECPVSEPNCPINTQAVSQLKEAMNNRNFWGFNIPIKAQITTKSASQTLKNKERVLSKITHIKSAQTALASPIFLID